MVPATPGGPLSESSAPDSGQLPPAPDILERAAVEAEVRRRVARLVADGIDQTVPGASGVTSRAQWGSLRDQLPRLITPSGLQAVARWFDNSQAVRSRRTIWGKATLDALKSLLTSEQEVWTRLGLDGDGLAPFLYAPGRADAVRAALRVRAVSILVTQISKDATLDLQIASLDGRS
jgi:hypothetical protein